MFPKEYYQDGVFKQNTEITIDTKGIKETLQNNETVKNLSTSAIRYDSGKNRLDLLPIRPLQHIAEVLTKNLDKYPERNWELGMSWSRCYASALRHLFAWWRGEDHDPQTGLSHLAHCACNILFLLEYEERKRGTDDRPK